jgi:hypothetical protein
VQQVRGLVVALFITTFFGALVGLGCALELWVSAFPPLISTLCRTGARPY